MPETYQDNMTLDEIASYDLEMTKDAIKNANKISFHDNRSAQLFVMACIKATLRSLGLPDFEKTPVEDLDRLQAERNIKIEHRKRYRGEDEWRSGIYIYKDDVLVSFISEVQAPKIKSPIILLPGSASKGNDKWAVITNVKRLYG